MDSAAPAPPPDAAGERRIDGWKGIAAYFGRERTTVLRWARERGLPVRSIPGGKRRTVYALAGELEAWSRSSGEAAPGAGPGVGGDPAPNGPKPRRGRLALAAVLGTAGAGLAAVALWPPAPGRETAGTVPATASAALPADPQVADLFVQARDAWAQRRRDSLTRAIAGFEEVTRRDPGFAPAWADLADAYILAREDGAMSDADAFGRAATAATAARRLSPDLPAASRALGFIAYWQDHDRREAARLFADALRTAPNDAQTHFWYANILADNGEDAAATREFNAARLLEPGSVHIAVDQAWARWMAGAPAALEDLRRLAAANPDYAEAHDCLAEALIDAGDDRGFLVERAAVARLRAERGVAARTEALEQAWRTGGRPALLAAALRGELAAQAGAPHPDHARAAFFASLAGDRAALLSVLQTAERQHESWGSAGYRRRIATQWAKDAEVTRLLAVRQPPAIEAPATG